ncbi:MAG TPA: hypothetical protein VFQ61_26640 [Polyangiaceae bacterium]|nr:hypothetical protein [Polyangiaceae bacterium]
MRRFRKVLALAASAALVWACRGDPRRGSSSGNAGSTHGSGGSTLSLPSGGQDGGEGLGGNTSETPAASGGAAGSAGAADTAAQGGAAGISSASASGAAGELQGGAESMAAGTTGQATESPEGDAGEPTSPDLRPWKLAFIAPGPFDSDFAAHLGARGVSAHVRADALCQAAAEGAGFKGTYHAWLSTSTAAARDYFAAYAMNGPWHRMDDELVAATLAELTGKKGLRSPILYGPDGEVGGMAWTGTGPRGELASNCEDFTTADADVGWAAYCATATAQDYGWSSSSVIACGGTGRGLTCFEQ